MPFKNPHPLYTVWQGMKRRCFNPKFIQWADYGGRGITVCDRWKNSFHSFVSDMGERPDGFVIDRINNDGNYEPSNCRWVDKYTSQCNRRITKYLNIEGKRYLLSDLARKYKLKSDTIEVRAKQGLSFAEVTDPKRRGVNPTWLRDARAAWVKEKTPCSRGHSFDNALITKEGWRACRACHNARQAERNRRKREAAKT